MIHTTIRIMLVFLVINQLLMFSAALRSSRGGKYSYNKADKDNSPKTFAGTSSGIPAQNATRRGLGISAWGIVAVVISVIMAGMGFYYFTLCYPILCKKQRKYDMIGLPSAA